MATASFFASYDQLYGNSKDHLILRTDISHWMDAHQEDHEGFVEDDKSWRLYIEEMRLNGRSGTHPELNAFARLMRRNVKVTQPGLVNVIEWRTCTGSRFCVVGYRTGPGPSAAPGPGEDLPADYVAYHD